MAIDFRPKDHALAMAKRGFRVFPLAPGSKIPYQGSRGVLDATTDLPAITGWPDDCNYGIACGNGLCVIDVDVKPGHPGKESLAKIIGLPPTLITRTPSGGWHMYYKCPIPTRSKNAAMPGIDFRADGYYVVGPGSVLENGVYEQVEGYGNELIELPPAILKQLVGVEAPDSPKNEPGWVEQLSQGSGPGTHDDSMTKLAGYYLAKRLNVAQVIDIIESGYGKRAWNEDGNGQRVYGVVRRVDIERVVNSIARAEARKAQATVPNSQPLSSRDAGTLALVDLSTVPEPGPQPMYLGGRLVVGYPNVFYAEGGKGKSMIALGLATCMAADRQFCNLYLPSGPVLYLDWELSQEDQARRAYKIARGLGLPAPPKGLLYAPPLDSLPNLADQVAEIIENEKPVVVVIDSLGPAAGGNPESAEETIPLFTAIRSLGVTSLILDHQSKMQEGQSYKAKTIFGSVYKFNLARSVLHSEVVSNDPGELRLLIRHKKSNFGPLADDLALLMRFDHDSVRFEQIDPRTDPVFVAAKSVAENVLAVLREGPATAEVLAERAKEDEKSVRNELTRLRKQGKVQYASKEGRKTVWALRGCVPPSQSLLPGISGRSETESPAIPKSPAKRKRRSRPRKVKP